MQTEQLVHLERVGRGQTLHIPQEFELASDDAMIRKEGERLIIDPVHKPSLLALLATLDAIEAEFPNIDADLLSLNDVVI